MNLEPYFIEPSIALLTTELTNNELDIISNGQNKDVEQHLGKVMKCLQKSQQRINAPKTAVHQCVAMNECTQQRKQLMNCLLKYQKSSHLCEI